MSFGVLNLLFVGVGALALSLPFLAHLLSKKKYDIVEWGAMQFLELGRNARRKLRLEQLLLMLLRMALVALIALALAQPWVKGGFLTNLVSKQPRDVVFVVDGSYSMGWEGSAQTPHADAVNWSHAFLEELKPGDTVAVIDARDQPRMVVDPPTRDFSVVREQLDDLPPPSGTSDIPTATKQAIKTLGGTNNLGRDIVIVTDGQAKPWRAEDEHVWARIDDLRKQASIPPRIWVVDVGDDAVGERTNFSVDRIELSRELTVVDFPLRIQTKVRYSGGKTAVTRSVYLEVDGQRLKDQTVTVQLEPNGEATVEFEYRPKTTGSHLVSVTLDEDNLPGDNRSDAAVGVAEALPVLLIDGDPQLDATRSETFFAKAALSAQRNQTPWIDARVVRWDAFTSDDLQGVEVAVLANAPRLTDHQTGALKDFVSRGGGLFLSVGDRVEVDDFNTRLFEDGQGLSPASLIQIEEDEAKDLVQEGVHVVNSSLELPWIDRFRLEHDGGFTEARYVKWWSVQLALPPADDQAVASPPLQVARLNTGHPLLISRKYGRGGVVLMTSPIDADWSTFPAKPDYVAFMHEVVFLLASSQSARNVDVGLPLLMAMPKDFDADDYEFVGPDGSRHEPEVTGDELRPVARFSQTQLPGVYLFQKKENGRGEDVRHFVVNSNREESDLTPLDESAKTRLAADGRLVFVDSMDELKAEMFADDSSTKLTRGLLLVFLVVLVVEVVLTRKMVQGGHAVVDEPVEPAAHVGNNDEEAMEIDDFLPAEAPR